MKQIQISVATDVQRMTSLEIADIAGKAHKNVMQAIRNMEPAWEKVQGLKFQLSSRTYDLPNGGTKTVPCYELTKTECLYVATKFNDEARARLVLRWQELEQQRQQQLGSPRLLVTKQEIVDHALGIMQREIEERNLPAEDCFTMTQIAEEFGLEARDLCSFLSDRGIIAWRGGRYRLQHQYQQRGYEDERTYCYFTRHGRSRSKAYMVWTPAGKRFVEKLVRGE